MTKKVTETIEIGQDWFYKHTIKEAIADLDSIAKEFGYDAIIYSESMGYDGPEEYFIRFERDETSEERSVRLDLARDRREKKAAIKTAREEQERAQYEKLKKKFG